jgi:anti-sigma-K factor RskA
MTCAMTCEEAQDLIPLYALGAAEPGDRDALRRHLEDEGCPACQGALAEMRATAAQLALTLDPVAPPPEVKGRLMKRVRREQVEGPVRNEAPAPALEQRYVLTDWLRPLVAAAAAAAIVYFAVSIPLNRRANALQKQLASLQGQLTEMQSTQRDTLQSIDLMSQKGPPIQLAALEGTDDAPGAKAMLFWDRKQNTWYLYAFGMQPAGAQRQYELWYIGQGGKPVAAGTFNVTASGEGLVTYKLPEGLDHAMLAAITDEPAGPPQQAPTGKIRLKGPVVQ